jgi:hypothetical protein
MKKAILLSVLSVFTICFVLSTISAVAVSPNKMSMSGETKAGTFYWQGGDWTYDKASVSLSLNTKNSIQSRGVVSISLYRNTRLSITLDDKSKATVFQFGKDVEVYQKAWFIWTQNGKTIKEYRDVFYAIDVQNKSMILVMFDDSNQDNVFTMKIDNVNYRGTVNNGFVASSK